MGDYCCLKTPGHKTKREKTKCGQKWNTLCKHFALLMELDPEHRDVHLQKKSQAYPERTYPATVEARKKQPIKTVRDQDKLISAVAKQRYDQDMKEWETQQHPYRSQYLRPAPEHPNVEAVQKDIGSIRLLMCPNCWYYVTENIGCFPCD